MLLLTACAVVAGTLTGCSTAEPLIDDPVMYQGNPGRTGEYFGLGPSDAPQLAWKFDSGSPVWSSPAVYGGILYVSSGDGRFCALDATTGEEKWSRATGEWGAGAPQGSPAVSDRVVYLGGADGYLYALDARSGKQRWRYQGGAPGLVTSGFLSEGLSAVPAVSGGVVYLRTEEYELCAVDALSGEQKWRHSIEDGLSGYPAAILNGLVFASEFPSPRFKAVNAQDGRLVWRLRWEDPRDPRGERVFCASASGGTVYLSGSSGCHALDAETGNEKWLFESDRLTVFPPAVFDGVVYVGSEDGRVHAVDAETGHQRWEHAADGEVSTAATIAGGVVYFGSIDGHVYALDARTGEKKWLYAVGARISTSVVVSNGMVYFGSVDGCLYALK